MINYLLLGLRIIVMKLFTFLFCIAILCASCTHYYYAPNTAHTPLLTEKKELRVTGAISTGVESDITAGEFQAAYAFAPHWGVMVSGFAGGEKDKVRNEVEKGNGAYAETGIGYFIAFRNPDLLIAEVYAGAGTGTVHNFYQSDDYTRVHLHKLFLQPVIGGKTPFFEMAIAPKISYIRWRPKQFKITRGDTADDIRYIATHPDFFAFEHSLILRGGSRKVKVQLGFTFSSENEKEELDIRECCIISLGVSLNLKPTPKVRP